MKLKKWLPIVLIFTLLFMTASWADNDELKKKERELE